MGGYTILFLVVGVTLLGVGAVTETAAAIANVSFFLFVGLFVASLFRGRQPREVAARHNKSTTHRYEK